MHVRERIGKKATAQFERKLKEFILGMPAAIARIDKIMLDEPHDSQAQQLAKYALLYLYDPVDFLPEQDRGLFGYIDDAYFVAVVYLRIIERTCAAKPSQADQVVKQWVFQSLESVRRVIPEECRKIEKTVSKIMTNQILSYSAVV